MNIYTIDEIKSLYIPDRLSEPEFNNKIKIIYHDAQVSVQDKIKNKRYSQHRSKISKKPIVETTPVQSINSNPNSTSKTKFVITNILNRVSSKTITSILKSLNTFSYIDVNIDDICMQFQKTIVNNPLIYTELAMLHNELDFFISGFSNRLYSNMIDFIRDTNFVKSSTVEKSSERTIRWFENTLNYISKIFWANGFETNHQMIFDIIDNLTNGSNRNPDNIKLIKVVFDNIGHKINTIFNNENKKNLLDKMNEIELNSGIKIKILISEITKYLVN
jgi:hypothetical protein